MFFFFYFTCVFWMAVFWFMTARSLCACVWKVGREGALHFLHCRQAPPWLDSFKPLLALPLLRFYFVFSGVVHGLFRGLWWVAVHSTLAGKTTCVKGGGGEASRKTSFLVCWAVGRGPCAVCLLLTPHSSSWCYFFMDCLSGMRDSGGSGA